MPSPVIPGVSGKSPMLASASKTVHAISCLPGYGAADVAKYVGKSVEYFCPFGYGKKGDDESHCAHFVGHALNIQVGELCTGLLHWTVKDGATNPLFRSGVVQNKVAGLFVGEGKQTTPFKGASVRVNEIYNSVPKDSKGDWDFETDPAEDYLIYVTVADNISKDRLTMGGKSKKHIGVYTQKKVYNYGNGDDQVKCDTVETFKKKFRSSYATDAVFLWSKIPSVGAACVHRGTMV